MYRLPHRYRVLAALSVTFGLLAYVGRGIWIIDAFASNIAAGFVGAWVTVALIDRAAEQREENLRRRVERVALSQTRQAVLELVEVFAVAIKASASREQAPVATTYRELFTGPHSSNRDWLDLLASCRTVGRRDWAERFEVAIIHARERLSNVVEKYVASLDIRFIETINDVTEDHFLKFVAALNHLRLRLENHGVTNAHERLTLNGTGPIREAFFPKLARLLSYYETKSGDVLPLQDFLRDDIEPVVASARLGALPPAVGIGEPPQREKNWVPWPT